VAQTALQPKDLGFLQASARSGSQDLSIMAKEARLMEHLYHCEEEEFNDSIEVFGRVLKETHIANG